MANLAIRGHKTRGWEVIKILKMLGGVNQFNLEGNTDNWYVLEEGRTIRYCEMLFEEKGFTLEEFFEKFPYKVGDRVRIPEYESEVCISKMYWDGNEVQYEVVTDEVEWYSAKELNEFNDPNKEETTEEIKIAIPKGYEFAGVDDDKRQVVFKLQPQHPKTYEECCKIIGFSSNTLKWNNPFSINRDSHPYIKHFDNLIESFCKLLICRDAYWKIAGEQMGLGKPWEPDWTNLDQLKYCIWVDVGEFVTMTNVRGQHILAFPTEEMRDTFYENFKDLIIECMELL